MACMDGSETKTILITGASTGIGYECARRMSELGWNVFAGVRKESDAKRVEENLGKNVKAILLDVTKPEHIDDAKSTLNESGVSLDGLLNNAGIAIGGPVEVLALEEFRRTFDVNFFGQIQLIQALLPHLRESKGRIVNMSSLAGKLSQPMMSAYCASKHAFEALSDSLRMELAMFDIKVVVIEPGAIKTPIWDKGTNYAKTLGDSLPPKVKELYEKQIHAIGKAIHVAGKNGVSASLVADALESAMTSNRPKTRYKVGKDSKLGILAKTWLSDRSMDKVILKNIGL